MTSPLATTDSVDDLLIPDLIATCAEALKSAETVLGAARQGMAARIGREREVRLTEIEKDAQLRRSALEAELATETAKSQNAVTLAARRAEEARAEAEAASARSDEADKNKKK